MSDPNPPQPDESEEQDRTLERKIFRLCREKYSDPELAEAVAQACIDAGAADNIEAGRGVLPDEASARRWLENDKGGA